MTANGVGTPGCFEVQEIRIVYQAGVHFMGVVRQAIIDGNNSAQLLRVVAWWLVLTVSCPKGKRIPAQLGGAILIPSASSLARYSATPDTSVCIIAPPSDSSSAISPVAAF